MKTAKLIFSALLGCIMLTVQAQMSIDWTQRYNGSGNSTDAGKSVQADASGNVYITGSATNAGGNLDFITVKYNSSGSQEWASPYNFGNSADESYAVGVSPAGNVYATGYSCPFAASADYATVKYNSSGTEQWAQRYNAPFGASDIPQSLVIDGSENIIVTGNGWGTGAQNFYTIKYNSAGAQQWIQSYNGPGNTSDGGLMVVVDAAENVYVAGYSTGSGTSFDFTTIKYNSAGAQQWIQRYNGAGNGNDLAYALAVDNSGNVYVTGITYNGSNDDYLTIKYDASGVQQWLQIYNGPGSGADRARSLALDAAGNVYVTGNSVGLTSGSDYATIKYNSAGVQQWVARYDGTASGTDDACALVVSDFIFVTGTSAGAGSGNDYVTLIYDLAGNQVWEDRYNGPANGNETAYAITQDNNNCVYVTGASDGSGSGSDIATIKYCRTTLPVILVNFEAAIEGEYVKLSWSTNSEIDYFIIERSSDGLSYEEIARVKSYGGADLNSTYSGMDENPLAKTAYYRLVVTHHNGSRLYCGTILFENNSEIYTKVFPNPASTESIIYIKSSSACKLIIQDMHGKEMMKFNESLNHEIPQERLLPGLYIYFLVDSNDMVVSGKLFVN